MNKHHDGRSEASFTAFQADFYTKHCIYCGFNANTQRKNPMKWMNTLKPNTHENLYFLKTLNFSCVVRKFDWPVHRFIHRLDQYDKCDEINYIYGSILLMSFIYICESVLYNITIGGEETSWQVAWLNCWCRERKRGTDRQKKARARNRFASYLFIVIIKVICEVESGINI